MAPTTLPGQKTTSSPFGRDPKIAGMPVHISEIMAVIPGVVYATRQATLDLAGINKTRKAIKRAFMAQLQGLGFSIVEVLSTCPTNWNMDPWAAMQWAKENMIPQFPLGDTRVSDEVAALKV